MNASSAILAKPAGTEQSGLRDVRREVAQAPDAQVLKVVSMVDALEDRGATDAVLDPIRPRLRVIQPARPLRFARLLFLPIDPLIVASNLWRAGTPFLPRTALMVLALAVRERLAASDEQAACLTAVDGLIATATTAHASVVRRAGALLWPRAATALFEIAAAAPDASQGCAAAWSALGLPAAELASMAKALAAILVQALALHDHDHAGVTLSQQALLDMMTGAESAGPRAFGMMLSLLVIRAPRSAPVLLAAACKSPRLKGLAEGAADGALDWVEAETADQTVGICDGVVSELACQTALLDALTDSPGPPARRRRVLEIRAHLLAGCLHRFEVSLNEHVDSKLQTLPLDAQARAEALDALEVTARSLRRFDLEARRLGAAAKFDALVQQVCTTLAATPELSRMDRARLVEILAGPEAAARVLAEGR